MPRKQPLVEKRAEKLFKHYYKTEVAPAIGHHTLTKTDELNRAGKKLLGKRFVGVFAQDRVPPLKDGEMVIINNHVSGQPGEHWMGGYKHKGKLVVFDSFARDLNKFLPVLSKQIRVLSTDRSDREQRHVDENCGNLSLAWLLLAKKHGVELATMI